MIEAETTAELFGWDVKECHDGRKISPRVAKMSIKILPIEQCPKEINLWNDKYFKNPNLQMCAKRVNSLQHPTTVINLILGLLLKMYIHLKLIISIRENLKKNFFLIFFIGRCW